MLINEPNICVFIHFLLFLLMQNEVESIRLRTLEYEMIIAQHSNFTIIATQCAAKVAEAVKAVEGAAPVEGEKKEP